MVAGWPFWLCVECLDVAAEVKGGWGVMGGGWLAILAVVAAFT